MNKQRKLKEIEEEAKNKELPLKETATNLVFGKGNPKAEILFIGEAPGAKEDEQGLPFIGAAGKELDKLLNKINLSIEKVYIANILKYRPPKNRDPRKEEIESHTPILIKQINAINPKIICTLGNYATKFILAGFKTETMAKVQGISKLHGKIKNIEINNKNYTIIPLYHPAAMLYNPRLRETLDEDFQKIKETLNQRPLI